MWSASLPAVGLVYLCMSVGLQGLLPASLPAPLSTTLSRALSVYLRECGAAGSASGRTACPVHSTLCQSQSLHGHASPLHPGCPSPPLLPVWMNVYFLFPWCQTSLPFDFLSVLVVRGGAMCLPTPPSWFDNILLSFDYLLAPSLRLFLPSILLSLLPSFSSFYKYIEFLLGIKHYIKFNKGIVLKTFLFNSTYLSPTLQYVL